MKIREYNLLISTDKQELIIPSSHLSGKILFAQNKNNYFTLWLAVNDKEPLVTRHFQACKVEEEIDDTTYFYINSIYYGPYLYHLFEIIDKNNRDTITYLIPQSLQI